jgi:hypothetical protein
MSACRQSGIGTRKYYLRCLSDDVVVFDLVLPWRFVGSCYIYFVLEMSIKLQNQAAVSLSFIKEGWNTAAWRTIFENYTHHHRRECNFTRG